MFPRAQAVTPARKRQAIICALLLLTGLGLQRAWARTAPPGTDADAPQSSLASAGTPRTPGAKYTTDFDWLVHPSTALDAAGPVTVELPTCPASVKGNEPEYWVYISGTATPEAVKVTGGTCAGDGKPGTLQFTTANPHGPGYAIGSASGGLQEASMAARILSPVSPYWAESSSVIVPPGTHLQLYARVSIRARQQTIDFSGTVFDCYMADTCIFVGDRANSNFSADNTLLNLRGRAMVPGNIHPMIEDNATTTRIINASATASKSGTFGTFIQVDDDQAFLLNGLYVGGYGLRCDATFCGSSVTAPGPFNKWSGLGWLEHLNITAGCRSNGVDWKSGNTLRISDSVIQGTRDFSVRTGYAGGGYGGTELDNVYMEAGNCRNRRAGTAGVIAQGGRITIRSDRNPVGSSPQFQNLGSTLYAYFVVVNHATYGDSMPLAAGWAKTDGKTPVDVVWSVVGGAAHYKLLRMTWPGPAERPVPLGTGNWLVATVDPSACDASFCKFSDTHKSPESFTTVNTFGGGKYYFPKLDYWPGNIVLGVGYDTQLTAALARLFIDDAPATGIVSVARVADGPVVYSESCQGGPSIGAGATTFPFMLCADPGSPSVYQKRGFILQSKSPVDGGEGANLKGRLNFLTTGTGPSPLITWEDADPTRTIANAINRPMADAADSDTGIISKGIQYTRANLEIRNYIGVLPSKTNWKEQLTATQKTFAVPVAISNGSTFTLGAGSPLSQMKMFTANAGGASVPSGSCLDVAARANGLTPADVITGITPPAQLGNISLNAYASAKDTVTLHFCNPSSAASGTPAGNYTFLAVH